LTATGAGDSFVKAKNCYCTIEPDGRTANRRFCRYRQGAAGETWEKKKAERSEGIVVHDFSPTSTVWD